METVWGIILIVVGLLGWAGQTLSAVSPDLAVRLGLTESELEVDAVFYADVRAECIWDSVTLWILPFAGLLLLLEHTFWIPTGLTGGGMYLYFAGRGILQRMIMRRRGIGVGKSGTVVTAMAVLSIWGLTGAGTIALAIWNLFSI